MCALVAHMEGEFVLAHDFPSMLDIGAKLPRVTVLDDSGKTVNTADLIGKTLVLWFYPKDDTPG